MKKKELYLQEGRHCEWEIAPRGNALRRGESFKRISPYMADCQRDDAVEERRGLFPAGLAQPVGSYRFGMDALLLAAFASCMVMRQKPGLAVSKKKLRAAELGSGCGVSLLAFAMKMPRALCAGLEKEEQLLSAARLNAFNLGLSDRVNFYGADLEKKLSGVIPDEWPGHCQVAFANPPWRKHGNGRQPAACLRRKALFGAENTLEIFCRRASALLVSRGLFCCILPPALLSDFCAAASAARLGLRLIWPVASFAGHDAGKLMLLCMKDAKSCPRTTFPLVLHERLENNGDVVWSVDASAFCPWLTGGRKMASAHVPSASAMLV